jgi:hypothetical protein
VLERVRMIFFCRPGSSASPISTPRSPRATITTSEAVQISTRFSIASARSIFGHQRGVAAGGAGERARLVHVGGGAAEGHGDEIDAQLRGDLDVLLVLLAERAQRQAAAEAVEALAVGQPAVGEHLVWHLRASTARRRRSATRPSSSSSVSPACTSLTRPR